MKIVVARGFELGRQISFQAFSSFKHELLKHNADIVFLMGNYFAQNSTKTLSTRIGASINCNQFKHAPVFFIVTKESCKQFNHLKIKYKIINEDVVYNDDNFAFRVYVNENKLEITENNITTTIYASKDDYQQTGINDYEVGLPYDFDYCKEKRKRGFLLYNKNDVQFVEIKAVNKIYLDLHQAPDSLNEIPLSFLLDKHRKQLDYLLLDCPEVLLNHPAMILLLNQQKKSKKVKFVQEIKIKKERRGWDWRKYLKRKECNRKIKNYKNLIKETYKYIKEYEDVLIEKRLTDKNELNELQNKIKTAKTHNKKIALQDYYDRQIKSDIELKAEYNKILNKIEQEKKDIERLQLNILNEKDKLSSNQ